MPITLTCARRIVFAGLIALLPVVFAARPCAQWVCTDVVGPFNQSGSITGASPTEDGRLVLDGEPSTCASPLFPTVANQGTAYHYNPHFGFHNTVGYDACMTITLNMSGCGGSFIQGAVYSPSFNPANPGQNLIGKAGITVNPISTLQVFIRNDAFFTFVFSELDPGALCPSYSFSYAYRRCRQPGFDANFDAKSDVTLFRPSSGIWYSLDSTGASSTATQFGTSSDVLTPGVYTISGSANPSVWRPGASAIWYYLAGGVFAQPFGTTGDIPVTSDFDADGKVDFTVFRPSTGTWWYRSSLGGGVTGRPWGQNGDVPIAGDFDGDLVSDVAIARPVAGNWQWWVYRSRTNTVLAATFGFSTDKIVAADYDGDRRTDIAVWRPSNGFWYYLRSSDGVFTGFPFGQAGDIPQPSDRDGDGKADFVVFRQSATPGQTIWYSWLSSTGTLKSEPWGQISDVPALAQNRIQ